MHVSYIHICALLLLPFSYTTPAHIYISIGTIEMSTSDCSPAGWMLARCDDETKKDGEKKEEESR